MMEIELYAIRVFGRHGLGRVERRDGQLFLFDVWLEPEVPPEADRIEETIDYREVASCVREVSDRRAVKLLETLAAAVADELMERFPARRVRVRVRKPEVVLDPPVEHSAVVVERP